MTSTELTFDRCHRLALAAAALAAAAPMAADAALDCFPPAARAKILATLDRLPERPWVPPPVQHAAIAGVSGLGPRVRSASVKARWRVPVAP